MSDSRYDCANFAEDIEKLLASELGSWAAEAAAHRSACSPCQALWEEVLLARQLVRRAMPEPLAEVSANFWPRFWTSVDVNRAAEFSWSVFERFAWRFVGVVGLLVTLLVGISWLRLSEGDMFARTESVVESPLVVSEGQARLIETQVERSHDQVLQSVLGVPRGER